MKVIQLPALYFPDRGGSETYVGSLSTHLQRLGVDVLVVAPGASTSEYHHNGIRVRRFPWGAVDTTDVRQTYAGGATQAVELIVGLLARERPDVVHVHGRTHDISTGVLDAIRHCGVPIVFTYHITAVTCLHVDLLRWGHEQCDGEIRVSRCAGCNLHRLGVPQTAAAMLGHVPAAIGRTLATARVSGRLGTALRMTDFVSAFRTDVLRFLMQCDRVIALSEWSRQLLVRNGVPATRTVLSRLGLSQDVPARTPAAARPAGPLRAAFLGRYDARKGIHILVQALRAAPDLPITLDIFSVQTAGAPADYFERVTALIGDDARIRLCAPIPDVDVVRRLADYDVLAVPSQVFETGPFVVIEAFAAGLPVIGSDLGGIAELVRHDVDGLLIPAGDVAAWTQAFGRLAQDAALLTRLRASIRPARTMRDVAAEALATYQDVAGAGVGEVVTTPAPSVPGSRR